MCVSENEFFSSYYGPEMLNIISMFPYAEIHIMFKQLPYLKLSY